MLADRQRAWYTPRPMANLIAWIVSVLLAALGLFVGGDGLRLAAAVLLVVAVLALFDRIRTTQVWSKLSGLCSKYAGPLIITGVACFIYSRLLIGDMPINHDHPVFLYRAFATGKLLSSGSLTGFLPYLFAGYPANSLYPVGADLLVCAVRGLSLGLASWEQAYCFALFLFIISGPLAMYALGRRFSGPLAGLTAGLLALVDRGAWMQGGWSFNLDWGVWSMGLSFSLCLWALWALDRLAHKPGLGRFLLTAAFFGGAILCHPMAVAILGMVVPIFLLVEAWQGELGPPGVWLPRVVGALALGLALIAYWLIPFVSRREWFEPLAYYWLAFPQVIRGVLDGGLLADFCPALLIGGLAGLIVAARRGRSFAWFLLVTSGLIVFFASNTFLLTFGVLHKFPALSNLQLARFTYFVRAAMLLGCGFFVCHVVRAGRRLGDQGPPGRSVVARHGLRALAVLAAVPFAVFAARVEPLPFLAPAKPLSWSSESNVYQDLRRAADFINQQDPASIGRIAVKAYEHDHLFMVLPVFTAKNIFKLGFTPEDNYRYKFESTDAKVWKALNVSHLLSVGPYHRADLTEIKRFGRLFLYRFTDYDQSRVSLSGPGSARVERDEPEALDVRISGTGQGSTLTVYVSRYALWNAELNGVDLPIEGAAVGNSPPVFMRLEVHDGLLRLRYRAGLPEWIGSVFSLLGWLALFFLIVLRFWQSLRRRIERLVQPFRTPVGDAITLSVLALAVVGLVVVSLRLLLPGSAHFAGRTNVSDLSDLLPEASAKVVRPTGSQNCQPYDGTRIRCPGPEWNYAGRTIIISDHLLRECIWLHPIQGAKFALSFDDVPLGDHIQGHFGMDDAAVEPPGPHSVNMTVLLDGSELGRFNCPSRRGWFAWQADTPNKRGTRGRVTIQSDAPFTGRRHFCFTAYTTVDDEDN